MPNSNFKLVYVDNCLTNYSGHSASLANSLLKTEASFIVLANNKCSITDERIFPVFSMGFGSRKISLLDVSKNWKNRLIGAWRIVFANAIYFRDLYKSRSLWVANNGHTSVLIVANAESRCSLAIFALAALYRQHKFVLYFQRSAQSIFQLFQPIFQILHIKNVRFVSETPEMAELWTKVLGAKCETFPFPVIPSTTLKATCSHASPLVFGVLGPPRYEKGFDLVLKAFYELKDLFEKDDVEFIIQVAPVWEDQKAKAAVEEFRNLAATYSNLKLVEHSLCTEEYNSLWQKVDIVLLPYRQSAYSLRSSGVLIEAIANAKPVIVTTDTLLSKIAYQHASAIQIPDENVEALVAGVQTIKEKFNRFQFDALVAAQQWREEFGTEAFLERICSTPQNTNNQ